MTDLAVKLIAAELRCALKPGRIDRAFAKLPSAVLRVPRTGGTEPVAVCAVQFKAEIFSSPDEIVKDIDSYMRTACEMGAELVCFPELFGVLLLGLSPIVRSALKLLANSGNGQGSDMSGLPDLPSLLKHFTLLYDSFIYMMKRFAVRYGVWLSCGTVFAYDRGKVYNRHTLLSPGGEIIGVGDKIHLTTDEIALGVTAGDSLTVVSTPIGNIALTVCMDATYFETFRVAKALGADYLLVPIGDMALFDTHLAYRGAQSRVSETNLAAVKSTLVSDDNFPVKFTGKAGIYSPLGYPAPCCEASSFDKRETVVSLLDLNELRRNVPEPFCRKNPAFDKRFVSELINYKGREQ